MIPEFQKGVCVWLSVNSATYASYMNIGQYLDHRQCSPGGTIRHQVSQMMLNMLNMTKAILTVVATITNIICTKVVRIAAVIRTTKLKNFLFVQELFYRPSCE